jgi:sugar lactone lactonase YvrE
MRIRTLALALLLAAACQPQATTVMVTIAAPGLAIHDLSVDVSLPGHALVTRSLPVSGGRPLLPGKLAIVLPDVAAAVTVTARATTDGGDHYAATRTIESQPHHALDLAITLGPSAPDLGADLAPSDGGSDGGGGVGPDLAPPQVPSLTLLAGLPGDNGSELDATGRDARFAGAWGIAYGGNGAVYVADEYGGAVRKVDAGGTVTTLALTDAVSGQPFRFVNATGVAFDGAGTLYVADWYDCTIRKITLSTSQISLLAGTPGTCGSTDGAGATASFKNPGALALDPAGTTLWVVDVNNATLRAIALTGAGAPTVSTPAGVALDSKQADGSGGASGSARFAQPNSLAFVGGALYVGDQGAVRKVVTTASPVQVSTVQPNGTWGSVYGLADDGAGDLIVSDNSDVLRKITLGATPTFLAVAGGVNQPGDGDGVGGAARFSWPKALAGDGAGTLWMTDDGAIRRIRASDWSVATLAGTSPHAGSSDVPPRMYSPSGLAFDGNDTVYLAEYAGQRIRKLKLSTGAMSTFAGSGAEGSNDALGQAASFDGPTGLALDGAGTLWVADYNSHILRTVAADGTVATVAGAAGTPALVNDTGKKARFANPNGLAFDGAHTLYIADSGNNVVRALDTGTLAVTTLAGTGTRGINDGCPAASATFDSPHGLAIDHAHNLLYVVDLGSGLVRSIDLAGADHTVTRVAGAAYAGGFSDGSALAATFANPNQAAFDAARGILYIADGGDNAVRALDVANANVSTVVGSRRPLTKPGPLPADVHTPWGIVLTPRGMLITSIEEHCLLLAN